MQQRFRTFQAGMCMKKNSPRSGVRSPESKARSDASVTKNDVPSRNVYENKRDRPKFDVRGRKPQSRHTHRSDSDFWLLTPVFCSSKNEGSSGYMHENKGSDKLTVAPMSDFITIMAISHATQCRDRAVLVGELWDHRAGSRKRLTAPSPVVCHI